MQSLLELKARDIARLQQQVEELQSALETFLPGEPKSPRKENASHERVLRSDATPESLRSPSNRQLPGKASGRELPRRITVSLNDYVHQRLIERSIAEGRSVSNLAAFILEAHLSSH
jgi:hypothetical protein